MSGTGDKGGGVKELLVFLLIMNQAAEDKYRNVLFIQGKLILPWVGEEGTPTYAQGIHR